MKKILLLTLLPFISFSQELGSYVLGINEDDPHVYIEPYTPEYLEFNIAIADCRQGETINLTKLKEYCCNNDRLAPFAPYVEYGIKILCCYYQLHGEPCYTTFPNSCDWCDEHCKMTDKELADENKGKLRILKKP